MITDTQTAKQGAAEGIELCIKVIIPTLFPFFIITSYLNCALLGQHIPGLRHIHRYLHIPHGSETLLLLGLIGGYPVGAQLIAETHHRGILDRKTAQILLGYCSNAGPSFIFGITPILFSSSWIPLFLWGIHLFSAILTGLLLPKPPRTEPVTISSTNTSLVQALKRSITICASVCGWIVIFKIVLAYLDAWVFGFWGKKTPVILSGILELSNGCIELTKIPSEAVRFVICAAFLAFGGICVILQTASVTENLGLGLYIPGKIMQTGISVILSVVLSCFLFPKNHLPAICSVFLIAASILITFSSNGYVKKSCGNTKPVHV